MEDRVEFGLVCFDGPIQQVPDLFVEKTISVVIGRSIDEMVYPPQFQPSRLQTGVSGRSTVLLHLRGRSRQASLNGLDRDFRRA